MDRTWMSRSQLTQVKRTEKHLLNVEFKPIRKNNLPRPLHRVGGPRLQSSKMLNIGDNYRACFIWKTAQEWEGRSLYGWLFEETAKGLLPLARMDYHPSHKPLHLVLNCESGIYLVNRNLVGCKEYIIMPDSRFDPDSSYDRDRFINIFCAKLNIRLGEGELLS